MVGYQEVAVPAGSSMKTATFKAISGNYKISDIQVAGALGGGSDNAYKLNDDGSWGQGYFYLTMDGTGYVEDGWYKDVFGDEPVTDEDVLTVGQAFIVSAASDITMTYAGQVIAGKPTVSVPSGASIIGNPTPAQVKISAIEVTGADGGGSDNAYKINADGSWGQGYFYLTMNGTGYVEDGWYKDVFGDEPVTDEDILDAGDSMIFASSSGMTLLFPAVLPEAN